MGRDNINSLKPINESYLKFIEINKIKNKDKCIFFEDTLENLVEAKNFGWITVYISRENVISEYVDFQFPNIYVALNYFLSKIGSL